MNQYFDKIIEIIKYGDSLGFKTLVEVLGAWNRRDLTNAEKYHLRLYICILKGRFDYTRTLLKSYKIFVDEGQKPESSWAWEIKDPILVNFIPPGWPHEEYNFHWLAAILYRRDKRFTDLFAGMFCCYESKEQLLDSLFFILDGLAASSNTGMEFLDPTESYDLSYHLNTLGVPKGAVSEIAPQMLLRYTYSYRITYKAFPYFIESGYLEEMLDPLRARTLFDACFDLDKYGVDSDINNWGRGLRFYLIKKGAPVNLQFLAELPDGDLKEITYIEFAKAWGFTAELEFMKSLGMEVD